MPLGLVQNIAGEVNELAGTNDLPDFGTAGNQPPAFPDLSHLEPDYTEAATFLGILGRGADPHVFQLFDDNKQRVAEEYTEAKVQYEKQVAELIRWHKR